MEANNSVDHDDPDLQAFQQGMQAKDQAKQVKEAEVNASKKLDSLCRKKKWRLQMKRT